MCVCACACPFVCAGVCRDKQSEKITFSSHWQPILFPNLDNEQSHGFQILSISSGKIEQPEYFFNESNLLFCKYQ